MNSPVGVIQGVESMREEAKASLPFLLMRRKLPLDGVKRGPRILKKLHVIHACGQAVKIQFPESVKGSH
jgi:hypothetical protein